MYIRIEGKTYMYKEEKDKEFWIIKQDVYLKNRLCLSKGLDAKPIIVICFDNTHTCQKWFFMLEEATFCLDKARHILIVFMLRRFK